MTAVSLPPTCFPLPRPSPVPIVSPHSVVSISYNWYHLYIGLYICKLFIFEGAIKSCFHISLIYLLSYFSLPFFRSVLLSSYLRLPAVILTHLQYTIVQALEGEKSLFEFKFYQLKL